MKMNVCLEGEPCSWCGGSYTRHRRPHFVCVIVAHHRDRV